MALSSNSLCHLLPLSHLFAADASDQAHAPLVYPPDSQHPRNVKRLWPSGVASTAAGLMSVDPRGSAFLAQEMHRLGLGKYMPTLSDNGFDNWLAVCDITQNDLDHLGFDDHSQRLLKRHIGETRTGDSFISSYDDENLSLTSPTRDTEDYRLPSKARNPKAGTGGKRRYRRHPKPDANAPKRPLTAYASFANHVRTEPAIAALSFVQIAREVGKRWQSLPQEDRNIWEQHATTSLNEYKQQVEKYKKTEHSRAYQRYLGDFKRQQQATHFVREEDVDNDYDLQEISQPGRNISCVYNATSTASSLSTTSPSTSDTDFSGFLRIKGSPSLSKSGKPSTIELCNPGNDLCPLIATQTSHATHGVELSQALFQNMMGPDSYLSRAIVEFRDRCCWLVAHGTPFGAISGPDYIDVRTFFDATRDTGFRVDGWACCLNRSFADQDVFVLLAGVMFQTHFMRWMINPTLDLYNKIPHMLQFTELQRVVPHPYPIDFIPIPALRDALIRDLRDWFSAGRFLSVNWPYTMDACIEHHGDGSMRLSARFMEHVANYENWSIGPEFIKIIPELEGQIRIK